MIEKMVPGIISKWPDGNGSGIYIQLDNAKPHINLDDPEFVAAARRDGFEIILTFQPPNSPDLKVLDLVFFLEQSKLCGMKKHREL